MKAPIKRTASSTTLRRSILTIAAVGSVALIQGVLAASGGSSSAKVVSSGMGHTGLETRVDAAVEAAFPGLKTPGLTVAVMKQGRLILTKGYGHADLYKVRFMNYMTRSRIGSVTKAAITGPSAVQLLKSKGIDPKTKKVYGPGAFYGTMFDDDILVGVHRFTPIAAMAIGADDRVYAWHDNGMVSSGWSRDLDSVMKPTAYKLPEGKKPVDIREISIAKDGQVYAWYEDGTVSVGTPTDLGKYVKPDPEKVVSFPSGRSMLNVVGIGIAKSNDHVYVWYDDGTFSSGTSRDFDYYFAPKPYSIYSGKAIPSGGMGRGMSRYHIRAMDIASNDHVYTWFSNNHTITGMSDDLDKYAAPAPYALAALPPSRTPDANGLAAYRTITIQHLLDHVAGFVRSGDGAGASKMFGIPEKDLKYNHVHMHFLRTRKLLSRPGTQYSYSNHGFGSLTMMVEVLSKKSFRNYVMQDYLAQMSGLGQTAVPESASMPTAKDAMPYTLNGDGKFVAVAREDSTTGLAAGGFMASARDLLLITKYLKSKYSYAQIDDLGWMKTAKGKLEHNGWRQGGAAYVAMFPTGYKAASGADLSDIHVAIAATADTSTGDLESLANEVALAVPESNVPATYDVWKAKPAN